MNCAIIGGCRVAVKETLFCERMIGVNNRGRGACQSDGLRKNVNVTIKKRFETIINR